MVDAPPTAETNPFGRTTDIPVIPAPQEDAYKEKWFRAVPAGICVTLYLKLCIREGRRQVTPLPISEDKRIKNN